MTIPEVFGAGGTLPYLLMLLVVLK